MSTRIIKVGRVIGASADKINEYVEGQINNIPEGAVPAKFISKNDAGENVQVPYSAVYNLIKGSLDQIYRTMADSYTREQVDGLVAAGIRDIQPTSPNDEIAGIKFPTQSGTYTNYGGIVVDLSEGLNMIFSDGDAGFTKTVIPIDLAGYATTSRVEDIEDELPLKARMFPGKNLFNINDPENQAGRFISETTGEVMVGTSYLASHFIEVEEGKTYALSYGNRTAWYDENKLFISGVNSSSNTRTAPSGARYIRVTINNVNVSTFQIELGTIPTSFEPFRLRTLREYALSENLQYFAERSLFGSNVAEDFENTFQLEYTGEQINVLGDAVASWRNTTSTFSGWGTPIGQAQNFGGITIRVRARATPITQIRLRIYDGYVSDPLLIDQTISVNIPATEDRYVTFSFPKIENVSENKLYVLYNCNALSDRWGIESPTLFPVAEGFGSPRYTTNGHMASIGQETVSKNEKTFVVLLPDTKVIGFTDLMLQYIQTKLNIQSTDFVEILIPSQLHATEGVQLNIFWDNVIFSNISIKDLDIDVTCNRGNQYERGWRYIPGSETGTSAFSIIVRYKGVILAEKSATINIQNAAGGSTAIKILCIGDSTTAGGQYISLINNEFGSNPSVTFIGTKGTSPNLHEGTSGWAYANFVGTSSPFYIGGQLDFAAYLTAGGWTMNTDDLITVHLGINDVFNNGTESNMTTIMGRIETLIGVFRAAVPNIRICLLATIPPSISQDAFGTSYQNGRTLKEYLQNYRNYMRRLLADFDTPARRTDRIFVAQMNCNIDRTYNFPKTMIPANSRTSEEVVRWTNGVHPANSGYQQMGDSLWMFIKNLA